MLSTLIADGGKGIKSGKVSSKKEKRKAEERRKKRKRRGGWLFRDEMKHLIHVIGERFPIPYS